MDVNKYGLNKYVDYTILRSNATLQEVFSYCDTVIQKKYYAVCVNLKFVRQIREKYPNIRIVCVIDFPLGCSTLWQKINQIHEAILNGVTEIDVVWDINLFLSNDINKFANNTKLIKELLKIRKSTDKIIKIIVEAGLINSDERLRDAINICEQCGMDYIKTSTGMNKATLEMEHCIKLWSDIIEENGYNIKIKASGGIKTTEQALSLVGLGASRIGTSSEL